MDKGIGDKEDWFFPSAWGTKGNRNPYQKLRWNMFKGLVITTLVMASIGFFIWLSKNI